MQDIRLVGNDGEYLNLETQGGEKFRLILDDSLRSAMKREQHPHLGNLNISPREIQDEVRAGASAEDVASKHAVPLEYVDKFAQTVIDEIGHIIASAQTVRISIAADRYSEATQMEFGEVLESRLRKAEATKFKWSATKREGSPWLVAVDYETPQGSTSAVWSFDQRKLVLSPENAAAVKLSAGDFAASTDAPKLRQIEPSVDETRVIELPRIAAEEPATPSHSPVSVVSSIEELTRTSVEALANSDETEAVEDADTKAEIEAKPAEQSPLSPTADLLDALRKKRAAAPAAEPEKAEEITPAPVVPASKKGRPSMPSWDEIVFGTKTED